MSHHYDVLYDSEGLRTLDKKYHKRYVSILMERLKIGSFAIIKGSKNGELKNNYISSKYVQSVFGDSHKVSILCKEETDKNSQEETFYLSFNHLLDM